MPEESVKASCLRHPSANLLLLIDFQCDTLCYAAREVRTLAVTSSSSHLQTIALPGRGDDSLRFLRASINSVDAWGCSCLSFSTTTVESRSLRCSSTSNMSNLDFCAMESASRPLHAVVVL